MQTMIDDLFDRDYQAGRTELDVALSISAARQFANAFKVLNRIEYSAPWQSKRTRAGCN